MTEPPTENNQRERAMGVKEMIAAAKAREEAAKAEKALKPAPAPRVFVKKHAADSLPAWKRRPLVRGVVSRARAWRSLL